MLTEESYIMAWSVYVTATLLGLLILYLWIGNAMSRGGRLTLVLLLGALALTPARPDEGMATWAPAVIVAAFDLLTDGIEAALVPLRSMLITSSACLALCLFVYLGRRLLFGKPGGE